MATERLIIVVDEKGARVVKRRIQDIGKAAGQAATGAQLLKRALAGIGIALVLRASIRLLAQFEQAMSTVKAVTGATTAEFEALTARARELGAVTRFTALDAAEGLVFLARAGFEVDEALASVGDTLLLAQAGGLDLASAADIAASTLRGFRIEADEAGRVTDVLTLAANSANTTVFALGDAIKFVAPVAAGLGISLEETSAALGKLSDAGLKGTLAGTGLRRVLAELERPSRNTEKILGALGVTTDQVKVSQVGLTAALEVLKKSGISTGAALEAFGQRGGPAFEVLVNSVPGIKELNKELLNAEGIAQETADTMDDNLLGALLRVRSAAQEVVLSFGDIVSGPLQGFLNVLAKGFLTVAKNVEILAGALAGVAILQIPRLIKVLKLLRVALISTGVGALVVGLGALIGFFISFRQEIKLGTDEFTTLGDFAAEAFEVIGGAAKNFIDFIKSNFGPAIEGIQKLFPGLELSVVGVFRTIAQVLDGTIGVVEGTVRAIIALFKGGLGPGLKLVFTGILNAIIIAFETQFNVITLGVEKLINVISSALNKALPGFAKIAEVDIPDVSFGRLELGPEAADLAKIIADEFKAGVQRTDVQDILEQVIVGATQRGAARAAEEALKLAADIRAAAKSTDLGTGANIIETFGISGISALGNLEREIDLLRLSNSERQISNDLKKIQGALDAPLTEEAEKAITVQLKRIQTLEQVSTILNQVRGDEFDLEVATAELNFQLEEGIINAEQYAAALEKVGDKAAGAGVQTKTFADGLKSGFNAIKDEITDIASLTEQTLVNAFSKAEDALVDFVTTGEADFKGLVDSILKDLTRLLIRQALLGIVTGGFGGAVGGAAGIAALAGASQFAGGGGGGGLGGLFQQGGFTPGRKPIIVGERGPELFQPSGAGRVTPGVPMAPPEVNIKVVNVIDPEEITAQMTGPSGEQAIINVLRRNRRTVRQMIGT